MSQIQVIKSDDAIENSNINKCKTLGYYYNELINTINISEHVIDTGSLNSDAVDRVLKFKG